MDQLDSALSVKGDVIIVKTDKLGNKEETRVKNLVVSVGKTYIASRMASNTSLVMSQMAVGTSSTPPLAGDTTLATELARVNLQVTGGTPSSNTVTYTANFNPGVGTGNITEAGVFSTAPSGNMLCRTTFPNIWKQAGDTITITWVVSLV